MKIITTIKEMQNTIIAEKRQGKTIGLVPTMGFLHEGHLSLVKQAVKENELVVMSIFINPLQFGPNEDYEQYPRDLKKDKKVAEESGIDILFHPSAGEMYPVEPTVSVSTYNRTNVLCGISRPGHFDGVATVLTKLFHIVMCDRAYFGMKDAQQAAVVNGLIRDFNFTVNLVTCPTVRETDGLAKSSRNVNLSETERKEAKALYEGLRYGLKMYKTGEQSTILLRRAVYDFLNDQLTSGEIDYVDVLTYPELERVDRCQRHMIIALAVRFAKARLIDNIILK